MAFTVFNSADGGVERSVHEKKMSDGKQRFDETPKAYGANDDEANPAYHSNDNLVQDSTHRKLKPRHIQLIGIGGYAGHGSSSIDYC